MERQEPRENRIARSCMELLIRDGTDQRLIGLAFRSGPARARTYSGYQTRPVAVDRSEMVRMELIARIHLPSSISHPVDVVLP
jgi:hypothetical protein